jgi:hypothetical protein
MMMFRKYVKLTHEGVLARVASTVQEDQRWATA